MSNDNLSPADERLNALALDFLTRMTNAWMAKGLPLPVLARGMIGFGTSCIEGSEGHAMAVDMIEEIGAALDGNCPQMPPLAS